MHLSNLDYTIGAYSESPEGIISTSGPALLAQTLAWAAQNDMPFHEVMLSLMQSTSVGFSRILFLLPRSKKWEKCLRASYSDLVYGVPLYRTLRKRFNYFLPEYYLQAVEKAEKEGHLQETLLHFAERLNLSYETKKYYKRAVSLPFIEIIIICCILTFLSIFIFPNFSKIFEELTQETNLLSRYDFIFTWIFTILVLVLEAISALMLLHLLGRIFVRLRRFILMLLNEIFIFIPPFRGYLRNIAFLELSSSMASYLDLGEDILNSAKFSEKAYDTILVDCLTLWINNLLYAAEKKDQKVSEDDMLAKCAQLKKVCAEFDGNIIFVINEVGMGIVPGDPLSRVFRDLSGRCSQSMAKFANKVVLVSCGIPLTLKDEIELEQNKEY